MKKLFFIGIIAVFCIEYIGATNTENGSSKNKKETNNASVGNENENLFSDLDKIAFTFPDNYKTVDELTKALIAGTDKDIAKARLIYSWVASHVKYDASGYNSGRYGDLSAEGVFKRRRAVCTGYGNLFKEMCDVAGLEAVKVTGYAKAIGYREGKTFSDTNHDWNAVKINGVWKLFDSTWGAGFGTVKNGKLVAKVDYTDFWFDVKPEAFIFTHLPVESKWQILSNSIDKKTFEKMPLLSEGFFRLGFDSKKCLNMALSDTKVTFPKYYDSKIPLEIISAPCEGTLSHGKSYTFRFKSEKDISIAVSNKDKWYFAEKTADEYVIEFKPQKGQVSLNIRTGGKKGSYDVLLVYDVK